MKTTNYNQFKFRKDNRDIVLGYIERLKASINKIGYDLSKPITVNESMVILDGQHRFHACKDLGLPIIYSIRPANGVSDADVMLELNRTQAIWRLNEYLQHFSKSGIKSHVEILEFENTYKLGVSTSIRLCCKTNSSQSTAIRMGKNIPLNPKRHECANFIKDCKELPFYKKLQFAVAVKILFEKAKSEHIKKLFRKRLTITNQPTSDSYLKVFENLINKGNQADNRISL